MCRDDEQNDVTGRAAAEGAVVTSKRESEVSAMAKLIDEAREACQSFFRLEEVKRFSAVAQALRDGGILPAAAAAEAAAAEDIVSAKSERVRDA